MDCSSLFVGDDLRRTLLTEAEAAVAYAIARGASNRAIAVERGRSVNTIANQIAALYRKLGVRSRQELLFVMAQLPMYAAEGEDRRLEVARRASSLLSEEDQMILRRRARGDAVKEIAIDLGVSSATVSRRLKRALERLGLASPFELPRVIDAAQAALNGVSF